MNRHGVVHGGISVKAGWGANKIEPYWSVSTRCKYWFRKYRHLQVLYTLLCCTFNVKWISVLAIKSTQSLMMKQKSLSDFTLQFRIWNFILINNQMVYSKLDLFSLFLQCKVEFYLWFWCIIIFCLQDDRYVLLFPWACVLDTQHCSITLL